MAIEGYLISAWQNHDGDLRPLTNIYHSLTLLLVRSVVLLGHSHVWAAWARAFYTPHKGYFTIPHATKYTVLKHIKPVPDRENAACKIHTKADGYCWISTGEGGAGGRVKKFGKIPERKCFLYPLHSIPIASWHLTQILIFFSRPTLSFPLLLHLLFLTYCSYVSVIHDEI